MAANHDNLAILTDVVLITCIVQRGRGDSVVQAAMQRGAAGATVYFARGTGVRERLGVLGIAIEPEKEVITLCVPAGMADEIFMAMAEAGDLGTPGMGFIYMQRVEQAATFVPQGRA